MTSYNCYITVIYNCCYITCHIKVICQLYNGYIMLYNCYIYNGYIMLYNNSMTVITVIYVI